MTEQQWIVQVGTDKETANPAYADEAGYDFFGPFDGDEASEFASQVRKEFSVLAELDPHGFVYGQVSVDVLPLAGVGSRRGWVARIAAGHWHLDREQALTVALHQQRIENDERNFALESLGPDASENEVEEFMARRKEDNRD